MVLIKESQILQDLFLGVLVYIIIFEAYYNVHVSFSHNRKQCFVNTCMWYMHTVDAE